VIPRTITSRSKGKRQVQAQQWTGVNKDIGGISQDAMALKPCVGAGGKKLLGRSKFAVVHLFFLVVRGGGAACGSGKEVEVPIGNALVEVR